jgi:hypothetical protein
LYDAEVNYNKVPYGDMRKEHWQIYGDIMNLKGEKQTLAKQWVKLMTK